MATPGPNEAVEHPHPRRRWVRHLIWVVVGLVVLAACSVAMLPRILGTESARKWMLSKADATLAPARLEISSFRFSWFGPTRLDGFTIIDADGEPVVKSRNATWDRNLFQILFDRPRYGTLSLDQAALDVEREADGRVDLYEALKPILNGPPETSLTILAKGRLRISSPGLERPIEGRNLALKILRPPAPEPVAWSFDLSEPVEPGAENAEPKFHSEGRYDRWKPEPKGPHDLVFSVEGSDWPVCLDAKGVRVRAAWTGRINPSMHLGLWRFEGRGALEKVAIRGPRLQGNDLDLDRLKSAWSVSETEDGWRLDSVNVVSDLGEVKTLADASGGSWSAMEGRLDLAETLRRLPNLVPVGESVVLESAGFGFRLERPEGREDHAWNVSGSLVDFAVRKGETGVTLTQPAVLSVSLASSTEIDGASRVSARAEVPELVWSGAEAATQVGPLAIEAEGAYREGEDAVELARLSASSSWGRVSASGSVTDLEGARVASLEGTVEPDWEGVNEWISREIEPGARVDGQPARFAIETPLSGEGALDRLKGMLALKLDQVDVYGMKLGDFALLAHADGGKVTVEPIAATLNGGRVYLEPVLEEGERGLWTLRMGTGTRIEGAEVNDEVSRRVLSYVAPVLDRATRVNGRISATFDRVEFPLGPDLAKSARVEGNVVFDEVAFEPGPLPTNIMAMVGREARTITLNEPVLLTIADGKVHQSGLKVPIGNLTEFSLVGDVGFDRSLDLTASIPMTSRMLPKLPVVGTIIDGARVSVPIGGTLSKPEIDRDRFRAELKTLERTLLERTATQGAAELLFRLAQPRPRGEDGLTPRERRQKHRMERKQERESRSNP